MNQRGMGYIIEGSAVRKTEYTAAAPAYAPQPERRRRPSGTPERRPQRRDSQRRKDRSLRAEILHSMYVVFATLLIVGACCVMLKLAADVRDVKTEVSELQTKLSKQQSTNEEYESGLDSLVDLDEIYRIATMELGMVYSEPGQTVYYSQNSDDYVVQYKNIPETN